MKRRAADKDLTLKKIPYKEIKNEFSKPSTEEKIKTLNDKMDMVLHNQRKMLVVLRQLTSEQTDSLGFPILSVNNIKKMMMGAQSEDWLPQAFPLTELEQMEAIEEEMNDPIKLSLYKQNMRDILKPGGKPRPGGLKKQFHLILAIDFLVDFNFDGIHNKIPLKKFENFNNALFDVQKGEGYFRDDYITEIRLAFRTYKNRRHKNVSDARRKIKEAMVLDSSFFLNESVCIACEINLPENKQARLELRELCRITALDGVSLLVKEVETGRVVSVSFNKIQFTPPPGDDHFFLKFRNERAKSPQARRLMDFMIEVDEKIDVSAMYKMDCFCELMFLATLPSHERLGLGRSLSQFTIQLTQELAEGKGLEEIDEKLRFKRPAAVTAIWTSSFSQKVGKATNFKVLNSVLYSEFEYKGKRFSEIINPLHKFCEHVIYKL
ncbi:uncharacterized protein LOC108053496 isoform X1 [Drosophila rhopaloa]|uniref:Uncharacterized protein LOC108053496 isoform X1 n=1 Tax=Drosophila rhopaloa TaxID=1041015 RepID=A0A6P4G2C8_DRORH|nr:uncharacterized protein LOC108053496 isoform X1 [Drosophila rhopaloa]